MARRDYLSGLTEEERKRSRSLRFYHVTPCERVGDIKREGLVPAIGDVSRLAHVEKAAVWFYLSEPVAKWACEAMAKFNKKPMCLLTVGQDDLAESSDLEVTDGVTHDFKSTFYKGLAAKALARGGDAEEGYATEFAWYGKVPPSLIQDHGKCANKALFSLRRRT